MNKMEQLKHYIYTSGMNNPNILWYNMENKLNNKIRRWCPQCKKKYKIKRKFMNSKDKVKLEQFLSGLCSTKCWDIWNGNINIFEQGVASKKTIITENTVVNHF